MVLVVDNLDKNVLYNNNNIINNYFIYTSIYYKTLLNRTTNTAVFKNNKNTLYEKLSVCDVIFNF